ncbi:MAG: hypothetical protein Q7S59_03905 [Sulfurimonas sp.]|nr:hypothetical protein [Sulfurimonas sp.]
MERKYTTLTVEQRLKKLDIKNNILTVKDRTGEEHNVRIVYDGNLYGRDFCLVHNEEPMIEFYFAKSASNNHPYGGFISRYSVSTIMEYECDICLDGYNPDGVIEKEQMSIIINWLKSHEKY